MLLDDFQVRYVLFDVYFTCHAEMFTFNELYETYVIFWKYYYFTSSKYYYLTYLIIITIIKAIDIKLPSTFNTQFTSAFIN